MPVQSLLDEITEAQSSVRGRVCKVRVILGDISDAESGQLVTVLEDPNINATTIATVLKRRGYMVGPHTVQRHRRGECSCDG